MAITWIIHEIFFNEEIRENKGSGIYFYTEISSIDVVSKEEILGICWRSTNFEEFH